MVSFWSLENTSWTDDFGANTLTGVASPTAVAGKVGNCVSLDDSSGQYLTVANNSGLQAGGHNFSFSLWINLTSFSSIYVFSKLGGFGDFEFDVQMAFIGSHIYLFEVATLGNSFASGVTAQGGTTISTGVWYHLVGTFDNSTGAAILYVNGSSDGTGTNGSMTFTAGVGPVNIGNKNNSGAGNGIVGLIDQVGYWIGRVLSPSDVSALYNGGSGLTYAAMA